MRIVDLWSEEPPLPEEWLEDADTVCGYLSEAFFSGKAEGAEMTPKLQDIEIETVNRCNNDCSFCPVSRGNDIRPYQKMELSLFRKIIGELEGMHYQGTLSLYSNNEPLLDERLFEMLAYARKKLPDASHALYTNGLLLNEEKLSRLEKLLDTLVIDIYSGERLVSDRFAWLASYQAAGRCRVQPVLRNKNQVLTTRAGVSPNKKTEKNFHSFCLYPFRQMVIRPDGKVSRCCHDAYGQAVMGDLAKESIEAVWNGPAFRKLRAVLAEQNRCKEKGCAHCDVLLYDCRLEEKEREVMRRSLLALLREKHREGRRLCLCGSERKKERLGEFLAAERLSYETVTEENAQELLTDERTYLAAEHFSSRALHTFQAQGRKCVDDFMVYFRCV